MKCSGSTTELDYADYVEHLRADHPELAATFAAFSGLESVLNWMGRPRRERGHRGYG